MTIFVEFLQKFPIELNNKLSLRLIKYQLILHQKFCLCLSSSQTGCFAQYTAGSFLAFKPPPLLNWNIYGIQKGWKVNVMVNVKQTNKKGGVKRLISTKSLHFHTLKRLREAEVVSFQSLLSRVQMLKEFHGVKRSSLMQKIFYEFESLLCT